MRVDNYIPFVCHLGTGSLSTAHQEYLERPWPPSVFPSTLVLAKLPYWRIPFSLNPDSYNVRLSENSTHIVNRNKVPMYPGKISGSKWVASLIAIGLLCTESSNKQLFKVTPLFVVIWKSFPSVFQKARELRKFHLPNYRSTLRTGLVTSQTFIVNFFVWFSNQLSFWFPSCVCRTFIMSKHLSIIERRSAVKIQNYRKDCWFFSGRR